MELPYCNYLFTPQERRIIVFIPGGQRRGGNGVKIYEVWKRGLEGKENVGKNSVTAQEPSIVLAILVATLHVTTEK